MPLPVTPSAESLADAAPCGLLITRADGTIVRANPTFLQWLGYEAEELVDRLRVQDLLTAGGRLFHQTHWSPLLQMQGSVAEVKLQLVRRDGQNVPVLLNALVRQQGTQAFHHLAFMVVHDRHKFERELIAARRKAEEALSAQAEAQRALEQSRDELARANLRLSLADQKKDEFLATLAHEMRNPLAPIMNVVAVFQRMPAADATVTWGVDVLQRQMRHIVRLVEDLMDVSRIGRGKMELRREHCDIATLLRDAVEAAAPMLQSAHHVLHFTPPAEPMPLHADATRLMQVFLNLLNNAAKYTPPGGQVWLDARIESGQALVSVKDSGIGIEKENLSTVFQMFSQLEPAINRAQGGLGIGLALVHGIVTLHDGQITAHSEGANRGSEFVVRLPLQRQH